MTDRNDGGPAFPGIEPSGDAAYGGMSLRDWFAGKCAASAMVSAEGLAGATKEERAVAFALVAEISYELADAMIAEREAKR